MARMRLDAIEIFVAVMEAGSFVGAARRLGVPPSTVSARVAALERRLGVTLIQRTTRQLRPTDAGQRYFEECRLALRQLESAEEELGDSQRGESGRIRLTSAVDIAQTLLPPVIAGFRSAYPGVRVELVVTDKILDMIAEKIDLAIRPGPMRDSSLIARAFHQGPTGLFASAAYLKRHGMPKSVTELEKHQIVGFSRMPGKLRMMRGNRQVELKFEGMVSCDDMMTARALVEEDLGIGFLPAFLAEEAKVPLIRVLPELAHQISGIFFVYPAQRFVPQRVRNFIAFATGEHRRR